MALMALLATVLTSCVNMIAGGVAGGLTAATGAVRGVGVRALPQGASEVGDFWIVGGPGTAATIIRYDRG